MYVNGCNSYQTTGSPVGILVDLGRARSDQSLVRPERVAGSVGLSKHLEWQSRTQVGTRLREALFITQTHATSSPGGGLNTHTVAEYDIITVEEVTQQVTLNKNDARLASLVWLLYELNPLRYWTEVTR